MFSSRANSSGQALVTALANLRTNILADSKTLNGIQNPTTLLTSHLNAALATVNQIKFTTPISSHQAITCVNYLTDIVAALQAGLNMYGFFILISIAHHLDVPLAALITSVIRAAGPIHSRVLDAIKPLEADLVAARLVLSVQAAGIPVRTPHSLKQAYRPV